MSRLTMTLNHEVDVLEHQFARNNVKTLFGVAKFVDTHRIEVTLETGEIYIHEAARFLISVGTNPFRPPESPSTAPTSFDSDEVIHVAKLPRSIAVIGAGVIGVEYATISARWTSTSR